MREKASPMYGISIQTAGFALIAFGALLLLIARPARPPVPPPEIYVEVTVPPCECHRERLPAAVDTAVTMLLPVAMRTAVRPEWEHEYGWPEDPWYPTCELPTLTR